MLWTLWVACGRKEVEPIDPVACFSELATTLSSDEMGGRGAGTEGLEKAALLLEERQRSAGLQDGGVGWRQPFQAITGVAPGPENRDNAGVPSPRQGKCSIG